MSSPKGNKQPLIVIHRNVWLKFYKAGNILGQENLFGFIIKGKISFLNDAHRLRLAAVVIVCPLIHPC